MKSFRKNEKIAKSNKDSLRICHLTVLNPAHHTRIFDKYACSQRDLGHEVFVCGQDAQPKPYQHRGIQIIPHKEFRRLHPIRLFMPLMLLRKALKIRPDTCIIHTPELLICLLFLRIFLPKCQLIYDLHEDYYQNIRYAAYYPKVLRGILSWFIRRWEKFCVRFVDGLIYAEKVYDDVLDAGKKKLVLPNLYTARSLTEGVVSDEVKELAKGDDYLLFTGTIAENWGVFRALSVWKLMNEARPVRLVIAGYAAQTDILEQIHTFVRRYQLGDAFDLIGGEEYVPHADILYLLQHCRMCMGLYVLRPNIRGKVPTKFFECMAFGKPVLFTEDENWNAIPNLGIPYQEQEASKIWEALTAWESRDIEHPKERYDWDAAFQEVAKELGW